MANFYNDKDFDEFANWFEIQAKEKMEHGINIYHYIHDNDIKVELKPVAKSDKVYKCLDEPLKAAYEHEQYVTSLISAIYAAAKVKDYRTMQFMYWFISEQCKKEKDTKNLITKYEFFVNDGGFNLYHLNNEMKTRKSE